MGSAASTKKQAAQAMVAQATAEAAQARAEKAVAHAEIAKELAAAEAARASAAESRRRADAAEASMAKLTAASEAARADAEASKRRADMAEAEAKSAAENVKRISERIDESTSRWTQRCVEAEAKVKSSDARCAQAEAEAKRSSELYEQAKQAADEAITRCTSAEDDAEKLRTSYAHAISQAEALEKERAYLQTQIGKDISSIEEPTSGRFSEETDCDDDDASCRSVDSSCSPRDGATLTYVDGATKDGANCTYIDTDVLNCQPVGLQCEVWPACFDEVPGWVLGEWESHGTSWLIHSNGRLLQNGVWSGGNSDLYIDTIGTKGIKSYDGWQLDLWASSGECLVWQHPSFLDILWQRPCRKQVDLAARATILDYADSAAARATEEEGNHVISEFLNKNLNAQPRHGWSIDALVQLNNRDRPYRDNVDGDKEVVTHTVAGVGAAAARAVRENKAMLASSAFLLAPAPASAPARARGPALVPAPPSARLEEPKGFLRTETLQQWTEPELAHVPALAPAPAETKSLKRVRSSPLLTPNFGPGPTLAEPPAAAESLRAIRRPFRENVDGDKEVVTHTAAGVGAAAARAIRENKAMLASSAFLLEPALASAPARARGPALVPASPPARLEEPKGFLRTETLQQWTELELAHLPALAPAPAEAESLKRVRSSPLLAPTFVPGPALAEPPAVAESLRAIRPSPSQAPTLVPGQPLRPAENLEAASPLPSPVTGLPTLLQNRLSPAQKKASKG